MPPNVNLNERMLLTVFNSPEVVTLQPTPTQPIFVEDIESAENISVEMTCTKEQKQAFLCLGLTELIVMLYCLLG